MNRKRNISYIKPEDPKFLKVLKKQAGFDDRNHKFDKLEISEGNSDDQDDEKPQVVVLNDGDLSDGQVMEEKRKMEINEVKADLNKRIIFKPKLKSKNKFEKDAETKSNANLLSFGAENDDEDSS